MEPITPLLGCGGRVSLCGPLQSAPLSSYRVLIPLVVLLWHWLETDASASGPFLPPETSSAVLGFYRPTYDLSLAKRIFSLWRLNLGQTLQRFEDIYWSSMGLVGRLVCCTLRFVCACLTFPSPLKILWVQPWVAFWLAARMLSQTCPKPNASSSSRSLTSPNLKWNAFQRWWLLVLKLRIK